MNSVLKFVQVFALGTWIGSIMYLSFIVAPGAFATLKDREQAGAMVGYSLSRLHLVGMIVGLLYLVTAFVLVRAVKDLVNPAILGVVRAAVDYHWRNKDTRRAIDIREGEKIDEAAFKRLIRAAVAANFVARAQRTAKKK